MKNIYLEQVNITQFNAVALLLAVGRDFGLEKNIIRVKYNNKKLSRLFRSHWGAGWDGWQKGTLDDASFLGRAIRIDVGFPPRYWVQCFQ